MLEPERHNSPQPTAEERRLAVIDAMAISPGLIRFASRFTRSLHDAEDAYQRAMEIALTRAPVTDRKQFLAWLRTVLKHEALAIASERSRESTGLEEDVADGPVPAVDPGPEATAEWRSRYHAIQDALGRLTESQRICLMLQSAGSSYAHIAEVTGFSHRKIERSVTEGRDRLRTWEVRIAAGEVCRELNSAIERSAVGDSSGREEKSVRRHVKHCQSCRALLASRSRRTETLAALVPGALIAQPLATATPDPGPYLAAWDRAFGGLTVRGGQLVQLGLDLPGTTLGRIAAGAGAAVLALVTAVPMVSDYVEQDRSDSPQPAAIVESQPVAPAPPSIAGEHASAPPAPAARERSTKRAPADGEETSKRSKQPASPAPQETATRGRTPTAERSALAAPPPPTTGSAAPPPVQAATAATAPTPSASLAPEPITSSDVVIPQEEPQAGPDGAVIYGD